MFSGVLFAPSHLDSCGCSRLAKLTKTSRPYAPNATFYWTVNKYDGIGRTIKVTAPDGASATTYAYSGATVTTTDAANKQKTFTTDEVGNLTTVQEPDPNLGTVTTSYTYDVLGQLRTVSMPRGSTTQTRTFVYAGVVGSYAPGTIAGTVGPYLMSATNPENGTVTNYYNTDTTLNYKVDAKGQAIVYGYDGYRRVAQISKYPGGYTPGGNNNVEDVCQRVNYYYDSNPDDGTYSQYTAGRLTTIHYAGANCSWAPSQSGTTTGNNYIEMYSYTQAGQATKKKLRLWRQTGTQTPYTFSADLEALYTYDAEGKMLTQTYPLGTTYQYSYDTLGRPIKMTDTVANQDLVGSVTYGPAGELISMSGTSVGETRTYNVNGQLTQINGIGMNIQYNYPAAGSNNGQIASQYDVITGETISYTYDSLKRLATATAVQGGGQTWNQNFGYDGFGNLTAKTGSGIAPVASYPADANTNRLSGVSYDNNGNQLYANNSNLGYDVSNRVMISTGAGSQGLYEYDAMNQRVYQQRQSWNGSAWVATATEFYFYGIEGRKLGTYSATVSGSGTGATLSWGLQTTQVYFSGKLVQRGGASSQEDIRGSIGRYYPYGEERDNTANDAVKFATYTRDSVSGLDYAVNRFSVSAQGRFTAPDPYGGSARPGNPLSWNRYAYVLGDPVNYLDPAGLDASNCTSSGSYSAATTGGFTNVNIVACMANAVGLPGWTTTPTGSVNVGGFTSISEGNLAAQAWASEMSATFWLHYVMGCSEGIKNQDDYVNCVNARLGITGGQVQLISFPVPISGLNPSWWFVFNEMPKRIFSPPSNVPLTPPYFNTPVKCPAGQHPVFSVFPNYVCVLNQPPLPAVPVPPPSLQSQGEECGSCEIHPEKAEEAKVGTPYEPGQPSKPRERRQGGIRRVATEFRLGMTLGDYLWPV